MRPITRVTVAEEFVNWFREAREIRELTLEEIARQFPFQVSFTTVSKWSAGMHVPTGADLIGLCVLLGDLPPALRALCPDGRA